MRAHGQSRKPLPRVTANDDDSDATASIDLVRRAKAGDARALDRLYERYYDRVRRIVRVRLGRGLRSHVDSGDILQNTFVESIKGLERFELREDASLIHWLGRIAENQIRAAADYHGAQKRDRAREVPIEGGGAGDDVEGVAELAADGTAPIDRLAHAEDVEVVESCLDELRPEYREVILHRDYAGASWAEVAEWVEAPSSDAARMLYARAIAQLSSLVHRRTGLA